MLKKTLAFGLLAAGTIGLSVPAQAQNVVSGTQVTNSQTVGANGSHVLSQNEQDMTHVLVDNDHGNFGHFPQPNLVTGQQGIGSTTVGVNGSGVSSTNIQQDTGVLIDSDSGNYGGYWHVYPQPIYGTY